MWVIFLVLLEVTIALVYLSYSEYYFFVLLGLLYVIFWYFSGAEFTGYEAKNLFRSWSFWRSFTSVKYIFSNKEEFNQKRKLLFILTSNVTNMALISGFGLHGGVFSAIDVRYVVPSLLLNIPVLREVLLWSGAVCAPQNRDVEGTILQLLNTGKSVAYCPHSNYKTPLDIDIKLDVFNFAKQNSVYLVPVLVNGETDRYIIPSYPTWLCRIQSYAVKYFQYPITRMFVPNVFGSQPPPKIELIVGMPMNPKVQQDAESFKKLFQGQINGFNC